MDYSARTWALEDHLCKACGGRILRCVNGSGMTCGGNPVFKCADCGKEAAAIFGAGEYSEARPDGKDEPHYEVSKEEAKANAQLLAAAPNLLRALQCLLNDPHENWAINNAKQAVFEAIG